MHIEEYTDNKCTIQSDFHKTNPYNNCLDQEIGHSHHFPEHPCVPSIHYLSSPRVTTLLPSHILDWFCLFFKLYIHRMI